MSAPSLAPHKPDQHLPQLQGVPQAQTRLVELVLLMVVVGSNLAHTTGKQLGSRAGSWQFLTPLGQSPGPGCLHSCHLVPLALLPVSHGGVPRSVVAVGKVV
eukprot:GFUD01132514.1.p1 GENE.GFUD01132514.1~~GFUD01132514.1.p1  ORF type:complete len:102 (-),score=20.67 GFUD01132514.1:66-371(-)